MIFRSLELTNFRQFKRYRIAGLRRVNLLVGDNNSGKTTVLEAAALLATAGAPWVLANLAWSRGEIADDIDPGRPDSVQPQPEISHFWFGHTFEGGRTLAIRDTEQEIHLEMEIQAGAFNQPEPFGLNIAFRVQPTPPQIVHQTGNQIHVAHGGILRNWLRAPTQAASFVARQVHFLGLASRIPQPLSRLWDETLKQGNEAEVIEAMRILEPRLETIAFLSSEAALRFGGRVGVLVALKDQKGRVPLASMGEGMYRLLELAVGLVQTNDGVLLVDEIDTGLHYSIQGDLWRMVVEAARRWNVQVFATTHSYDCIRGLAWLCENYPELGKDVTVQKIEPQLEEAVDLDAEKIQIAFEQNIEMR